jgi:hypothetical protein
LRTWGGGAYAPEPFGVEDATAGVENELQAVVLGGASHVDLPLTIRESNYFANIRKRRDARVISQDAITRLERYLQGTPEGVWENSWVRFPVRSLNALARQVLDTDLLADKTRPELGPRADMGRFFFRQDGQEWVRLPVSYLLRLALADVLGAEDTPAQVFQAGQGLLDHFSNDNTSPEIHSFHVIPLTAGGGMGQAVARETAKRLLCAQLLVAYANIQFRLEENGQRALIYFAPHPPVRQQMLNQCVSDAFYRELFMSPCLAGWDHGEAKQEYMHLCHQVLSRSQLNAMTKLREAGIITQNLVVLPNTSNISLANNGTHLSLGSRLLSAARRDARSGFSSAHEKALGDLAIKIQEHFLPLFVGIYSADPYRLDFRDFHPERVLGFLPHELDFTHLRLVWKRWRKKAKLKVFGYPVTPFGPPWLDRPLAALFRLRGDLVPDFRILDYLVALLSTEESPGLDGRPGNTERLKADLADLGIFDRRMALYLPIRLREHARMGFSGFEGRHYSQFPSFIQDLGPAVNLQLLITAFAFLLMARGEMDHLDIPDTPMVESERRQLFFATAIGLRAVLVTAGGPSRLLEAILKRTARLRPSRRHAGWLRLRIDEYQRGLLALLQAEAPDLIAALSLTETLAELARRLEEPSEGSAAGRLLHGILKKAGVSSAFRLDAGEFNRCAEAFYRDELRRSHLTEAVDLLGEDFKALDRKADDDYRLRQSLREMLGERTATEYLRAVREDLLAERLPARELRRLLGLLVQSAARERAAGEVQRDGQPERLEEPAPVR